MKLSELQEKLSLGIDSKGMVYYKIKGIKKEHSIDDLISTIENLSLKELVKARKTIKSLEVRRKAHARKKYVWNKRFNMLLTKMTKSILCSECFLCSSCKIKLNNKKDYECYKEIEKHIFKNVK